MLDSLSQNLSCDKDTTAQTCREVILDHILSVRTGDDVARHRRNTLIRQRQTLTHFIDSVEEASFDDRGLFRLALKEAGRLFRYNLGPEGRGFMLCPTCGCSEPLRNFKAGKGHKRLRPSSGTMTCTHDRPWTKDLAYGHQFQSFCLIARPIVPPSSIESLAFALQKGLCVAVDVEAADIGASWRWLTKRDHLASVEIILYDRSPGGAGFVKEGCDNWQQVVKQAQEICNRCYCERACYDCLKDYGNQSYHEQLNRWSVSELLKT